MSNIFGLNEDNLTNNAETWFVKYLKALKKALGFFWKHWSANFILEVFLGSFIVTVFHAIWSRVDSPSLDGDQFYVHLKRMKIIWQ